MLPIVLAILDGFGYREEKNGNAIKEAKTPNFDKLWQEYPHSLLEASGNAVGLPKGQMGNSEVGHLTIGAGRTIYQGLELINQSIENGSFQENQEFLKVINHVKKNHSKLHLFGLLSDGGIHSHINHLYALLDLAKKEEIKEVYVHAFLDGRDTLPNVALTYLDDLTSYMKKLDCGKLADISGRYYSMDRERMWNLTNEYYRLLVYKEGLKISDYHSYIKESYQKKIYDEFIIPARIEENGTLQDDDGAILFNFRPDRATQLFTAITNSTFTQFPVENFKNLCLVTMMSVEKSILANPAFPPLSVENPLGVILSEKGYKVLRIAEASKYPHVTYFFDGGEERTLENTDCLIVPRKDVATYDMYPAMSSFELTDKLLEVMGQYDVIILNFANCDMVGHTGNYPKVIEAVEAVDKNLGRIYEKVNELDGTLLVTADHGNAEYMFDEDGHVITSHTCNKVPFILCQDDIKIKKGSLANIAGTILSLLKEDAPIEMEKGLIELHE